MIKYKKKQSIKNKNNFQGVTYERLFIYASVDGT